MQNFEISTAASDAFCKYE